MANAVQKIVIHADDKTANAIGSAIRNAKRLDNQMKATDKSMRTMTRQSRAHFGQLGHQVQDVAVQLQMGMNPLMVLGQQGSQVASIFGAKGAMIGGLIAVAAVVGQQLAPALFKASRSTDDLLDETNDLDSGLKRLNGTLIITSERLAEAFQNRSLVSDAVILQQSAFKISDAMGLLGNKVTDLVENIGGQEIREAMASVSAQAGLMANGLNDAADVVVASQLSERISELAEKFGVSEENAATFAAAASALSSGVRSDRLDALARSAASLAITAGDPEARKKLTDFAIEVGRIADEFSRLDEQRSLLDAPRGDIPMFTEDQLEAEEEAEAMFDRIRENRAKAEEERVKRQAKLLKERQDALVAATETEYKMLTQANALTLSVMTPREKLNESLATYKQLLDAGFISQETFNRANEKAIEVFNKLNEATQGVSEDMPKKITELQKYANAAQDIGRQTENAALKGVRSLEEALLGVVNGTKSAKDAFRDMASSIINDLIRMQIQQSITGPLAGALGGLIGNIGTAAKYGTNVGSQQTAMLLEQDFNGGGFTGSGPRTGGLDGKGGFAAMLHPNETVIDHTKGQSVGGVVVNQTINISTGVQQTVRNEIATLMPQIANASKQAVLDARRRGGSFATAFGG